MNKTKRELLDIALFVAFFIIIIAAPFLFPETWRSIFASIENIAHTIHAYPTTAPLVFIGLQTIQVVIFIIPGEVVQIAGGYLFGVWYGTLFSFIGIALGTVVNWYVGYLLGARFVRALCGEKRYEELQTLLQGKKAQGLFLLLFLIPGIPKDLLTYIGGASHIPGASFIMLALLGRMPALVGSSIIGSNLANRQWVLSIALIGAATIICIAGVLWRERILKFFSKTRTQDTTKENTNE